jgi:hypothetical protein
VLSRVGDVAEREKTKDRAAAARRGIAGEKNNLADSEKHSTTVENGGIFLQM